MSDCLVIYIVPKITKEEDNVAFSEATKRAYIALQKYLRSAV